MRIENKYTDDPTKLSAEIRTFYENLYKGGVQKDTGRNIKTNFLANDPFPILSEEERADREKEITIEEISHALRLLNKDVAPDSEGLPPAFYSQFCESCFCDKLHEVAIPFVMVDHVMKMTGRLQEFPTSLANMKIVIVSNVRI